MTTTRYVLDSDFESFNAGTEFVQTATYGDGQIEDLKLEVDNNYSMKSIKITEEECEEFFNVIN